MNERIDRLESLPVPAGVEVIEKFASAWPILRSDYILYRVPMPIEEAKVDVRRRFEAAGWVADRGFASSGRFVRDRDCVFVYMQSWTRSPEWSRSENTHLRMSSQDFDHC